MLKFALQSIKTILIAMTLSISLQSCTSESTTSQAVNDEASSQPTSRDQSLTDSISNISDPQLTDDQKQAIKRLEWVNTTDIEKEIQSAIKNNDFRLYVLASRGNPMPGIDVDQQQALAKLCGTKFIPGAGDTLLNQYHQTLMEKALTYAEQFNQTLSTHCKSNPLDE